MNSNPRLVRCAIYTRKSSEEGLEMSFNSLDAQREACQAFIASQRQEGWRALPTMYDDGGYSGGSMERPALKRLLKDVENGQVDTIVVYKVDRLTRSLADFAKIVEALDARGVAFVSVTQQFNTTNSMGRLTLNVLLSFAQFEREVTGERIRDKIAASKRKGMWMGGRAPVGYDARQRKLVVNQAEAEIVNDIYRSYLDLGSVSKLKAYLDQRNIKSKERISAAGKKSGGVSYFPGALYLILQNRIYRGEVRHQERWYPGEHEPIVSQELWERVQGQLRSDNQGRRNGVRANCSSMLAGLLVDVQGARLSPSHTVRNGKRYRYYIQQPRTNKSGVEGKPIRLPAYEVERQVVLGLQRLFQSADEIMKNVALPTDNPEVTHQLITAAMKHAMEWPAASPGTVKDLVRRTVRRVVFHSERLEVELSRTEVRGFLSGKQFTSPSRTAPDGNSNLSQDDSIHVVVQARVKRCSGEMRIVDTPDSEKPDLISPILRAVTRAYTWREAVLARQSDRTAIANKLHFNDEYFRRVMSCAFLAPDIVEAILHGNHPPDLTVKKLSRRRLPLNWEEQRRQLGFPPAAVRDR